MGGVASKGVSKPHGMSLWKNISGGCHKFYDCVTWKMGNGACIRFWKDLWVGDIKLMHRFPTICAIAHDKDIHVDKAYLGSDEGRDWEVQVCRNLQDWEMDEYCNLLSFLSEIRLGNQKDQRIWKLNKQGQFR